jgi:Ca2+-binding RTX toxin-like protein
VDVRADRICGGPGDDTILGGPDDDVLTGGEGSDVVHGVATTFFAARKGTR